ncbi:MAG: bifunctional adenosylcobinamide kinase/adenosylcobinamide-phosphate guanylyltransferase [Chloroflexaceae bacterium]|nr:bifunctional adenosylcobinamide kinase/adenosylcobinamide-phosphate guanylyltransferase [Chloroflexaceae bacterium]
MSQRRLILITGGARSGKSTFGQQIAEKSSSDVLFVATAQAGDADMAARIAQHQAERPAHWRTLETPQRVAAALHEIPAPPTVLLDCVTLWVTNLLLADWHEDGASRPDLHAAMVELEQLLDWYRQHSVVLIVVSNEVGLGIVPADPLTRTFRDWLGRFNQRLAAEADEVYLLIAGLPVELKSLALASVPHVPKGADDGV